MSVTKDTLDTVERYHVFQRDIDRVDALISTLKKALKPVKATGGYSYNSGDSSISDNLGADLVLSVGPGLVKLLEAERVTLLAEQGTLSV